MASLISFNFLLNVFSLVKCVFLINCWEIVEAPSLKEKLKKLFDKFSRLDDSTTRTTRGTGLGLYIVKGLVEAMNGEIRIYSNEDCGFCVKVSMPVNKIQE